MSGRTTAAVLVLVLAAACAGSSSSAPIERAQQYPSETVRGYMAPAEVELLPRSENVLVLPPAWRGDRSMAGAVFIHGLNGRASDGIGGSPNGPGTRVAALMRMIALEGVPVLSIGAAGNSWGNDKAMADVTAAMKYLDRGVGARRNRVVLIGISMGGQIAMVWAASHRASVAGVAGLIPVSSLTDFYDNNRLDARASIDSAYGGPLSAKTLADRDPLALARTGKLAGVALAAWYGRDDTDVPPQTVQALVSAIGPTASATPVFGTHATAPPFFPLTEIAKFVEARSSAGRA